MIRILDNDTLVFLRERQLPVTKQFQCYVPVEIHEEFSGDRKGDGWFKSSEFITPVLDLGLYLEAYVSIINRYPHVSFYSLKGLGDVAILATASSLLREHSAPTLFRQSVCVVSRDQGLRKFALQEFADNFSLETPEEFAALLGSH